MCESNEKRQKKNITMESEIEFIKGTQMIPKMTISF